MREAGDVCFSDVYKDGTGAVEFLRYEDMKYAIKRLDDSKFRSHEVFKLFRLSNKQVQFLMLDASTHSFPCYSHGLYLFAARLECRTGQKFSIDNPKIFQRLSFGTYKSV